MTDMTGFKMTARDVFADADEDLDGGVDTLEFYTYLKDAIDAGDAEMVSENRAKAQTKADKAFEKEENKRKKKARQRSNLSTPFAHNRGVPRQLGDLGESLSDDALNSGAAGATESSTTGPPAVPCP